ncbi:MAG TPA: 4'-phosphopantetheinyl transferase superfamily protein [Cytophagales bacterium]|nr:4'-phosphopantetheinyl transferase superfamily protein [Cytophagales bacterium]
MLLILIHHIENDSQWPQSLYEDCLNMLSGRDYEKTMRLRRWQDQQAYILGRLLLKHMLKEQKYKCDLEDLRMDLHKKPYLPEGPHFNISHSEKHVVCALSPQYPIGIDVEELKLPGVIDDFKGIFSKDEWTQLMASPNPESLFITYWTRKESVLKAYGVGLVNELDQIDVCNYETVYEGQRWYIAPVPLSKDCICHMATHGAHSLTKIRHVSLDTLMSL